MNGLHLSQNEGANCQPNMIQIYNYIKLMCCKTNVNILSACSVDIVIIVTRIANAMVGYITILTVIEYIVNCKATAAVVLSTGSHLQTVCCGIWNMLNLGQKQYMSVYCFMPKRKKEEIQYNKIGSVGQKIFFLKSLLAIWN